MRLIWPAQEYFTQATSRQDFDTRSYQRRKDLWISSPPNSSYLHFMAITTQSLPFIGLVSNCQSAMKYLYQSQVSSSNSGQTSTRQREMARIWIRFGEVKFQIQTLFWESMFSLDRRWWAVNVSKTIRKMGKVGKNRCKHHKQYWSQWSVAKCFKSSCKCCFDKHISTSAQEETRQSV